MSKIRIGNKQIGDNCPAFIVAEISANHGQKFDRAVNMIKEAKACGADAVKFQTYTPDTITLNSSNKYFQVKHPKWGGQTLYQLYKKGYTPWHWFKKLKKVCDDEGICFFSSAFDKTSIDLLEDLNVPAHKISSFELVDIPLIKYAAKTKKPLIMSSGMASEQEIEEAVKAAREAGAKEIILLKCVSNYPAIPEEMNLRAIPAMEERFKCPIGFSDHTLGVDMALVAVTLGAVLVEKHFILSKRHKTPDSFFSIDPHELKTLVDHIRLVEKALGQEKNVISQEEMKSRVFRRSLFAVRDIKKGEKFDENNVRSIRPGHGLSPKYADKFWGKQAIKNIKKGSPLRWDYVNGGRARHLLAKEER